MRHDLQAVVDDLESERGEFVRNRNGLRQVKLRKVNGHIELTVIGSGIVASMDETAVLRAFHSSGERSGWRYAVGTVVRQSGHGTIELVVEPDGQVARERWKTTITSHYRCPPTPRQTLPDRM